MAPETDPSLDRAAADLRPLVTGAVLTPASPDYDSARRVWNAMVDKRPGIIVRAADAADVASAVTFARRVGLEIGVKCGGHGIIGQAVPEGGLMIDLGSLSAVEVDPDRRTAQVGGGALLGDLDRASQAHALATTAGNVSHTGVGGLTLGGGMGWLARRLGLACDNVIEYELVGADGSILVASERENADLFWGLRGGGGNFGVVTRFTFRLHPVAGQVLSVDFFYRLEHGHDVIRRWVDFARDAPREATPTAWTGTVPEAPWLDPAFNGQQLVNAGFIWVGDPEAARRHVDEVRSYAPVVAELVEEMTYVGLQSGFDASQGHGLRRYWKDTYHREFTDEATEAFLGLGGPPTGGLPLPTGSLLGHGGAIADVAMADSAFSHRDALVEFVTASGWEDPAEDDERMAASRRYAAAMQPFASGAYVNALADEGAAGLDQAYGAETMQRLTALKDRYDPDNVFHLNHNVRPTSGA